MTTGSSNLDEADVRAAVPRTGVRASDAFAIAAPEDQTVPVVFASPHSGRDYPASFLAESRLDPVSLRQSEDAFVDELFAGVVGHGAPLIRALFPRAFVDVNREALELDPAMFEDALPSGVNTSSSRVSAGLGTIAKVVANGQEIYDRQLTFADAEHRIDSCYRPYHRALRALVNKTVDHFGHCLLVDCHSMPSSTPRARGGLFDRQGGKDSRDAGSVDIVLGDCWGSACSQAVSDAIERAAHAAGFRTRHNVPYAGGYVTKHYGRPASGIHAVQIELRRSLYMDEAAIARSVDFEAMRERISRFSAGLCTSVAEIFGAPGKVPGNSVGDTGG